MSSRSTEPGEKNPPAQSFALRLKQLRVVRGYGTAREFARALGVDENRYTRWERGETEPSIKMLARIAELLNLSIDAVIRDGDLLTLPGDMQSRSGTGERRTGEVTGPLRRTRVPSDGLREEAGRFASEKSEEELRRNVLIASRAHLMSLLEARVAAMTGAEIDAAIRRLSDSDADRVAELLAPNR